MSEPTPQEQKVINFMEEEYGNWCNFLIGFDSILLNIAKDESLSSKPHFYWMVLATFLDTFIGNFPSTDSKQEKVDLLISVLKEIRNKPADAIKIVTTPNKTPMTLN